MNRISPIATKGTQQQKQPLPLLSVTKKSNSQTTASSSSLSVATPAVAISPPSLKAAVDASMDTASNSTAVQAEEEDASNKNDTIITLQTCSAQELVTALIAHGGKENAVCLLEEATKLAKQQQQPKDTSAVDSDTAAAAPLAAELGDALLVQPMELPFVTPRLGKFQVQFHQRGLRAVKSNDDTQQLAIVSSDISHVLVFPKPEDCKIMTQPHLSKEATQKKLSGCLVLLQLRKEMVVQKKSVTQLCFTLPTDKKLGPVGPDAAAIASPAPNDDQEEEVDATSQWCTLLQQSLVADSERTSFVRIQPGVGFKSFQPEGTSTTSGGMPFVKCYMGVNDGVLYPLPEGLLFHKPPKFVPRSDLASIACGRGGSGGQSSSRYVDMMVQLHNDDKNNATTTLEFSNIQREETGVLNHYIHKVLIPAMQADAESGAGGNEDDAEAEDAIVEAQVDADDEDADDEDADEVEGEVEADSDDDDEDEDDESFADDQSDEDDGGGDSDDDDPDPDDDFEVVQDDFAKELVKEKRKQQEEDSATESEDEVDDDDSKPRTSKRLKR